MTTATTATTAPPKTLEQKLVAAGSTRVAKRAAAPVVQTSAGQYVHVPLDRVDVKHQPRTHFDPAKLEELADSIRQKGVVEPVLVRPLADQPDPHNPRFELVAGERRFRASKLAGKDTIPAICRSLTDLEVLEIQIIENMQREGLLPLEEAQGYVRLMAEHQYTADQIAARIGKSRRYVFARIQLTKCAPAVLKALEHGYLDASAALLFARIPVPSLQEQALEDYHDEREFGGRMNVHQLEQHLRDQYTLDLHRAPFDPEETDLVIGTKSCTDCPKRTGNCADRYPEIKSADVCTDPDCYGRKKEAAWQRTAAAAKAAGKKVMTLKQSQALFPYGNSLGHTSGANFVELDDKPAGERNRTYREILDSAGGRVNQGMPKILVARAPDGKPRELVLRKEAAALVKQAGLKVAIHVPQPRPTPEQNKADREKQEAKKALRQRAAFAAVGQLVTRAEAKDERWLYLAIIEALQRYGSEALCARRGWKVRDLDGEIELATLPTLRGIALELALSDYGDLVNDYNAEYSQHLLGACRALKIDLGKIEKQNPGPPAPDRLGIGTALNQGNPVAWLKDTNAVRVTYKATKGSKVSGQMIVMKDDVDTLTGAGVPTKVEFGKVPFDHKRRPRRTKFQVVK